MRVNNGLCQLIVSIYSLFTNTYILPFLRASKTFIRPKLAIWYITSDPDKSDKESASNSTCAISALRTRQQELEECHQQRLVRDRNMRFWTDDPCRRIFKVKVMQAIIE
jgi:hypothetical protein